MQRRQLLTVTGVSIAGVLAGCSGSDDEDDYEPGNGDDDDGGDDDDNGGGDGNTSGNGNGEPDLDDFEIVEHELVVDEGEFVTEIYVEGVVQNNSGDRANYVQVTARVYDEEGNQVDSYIDNTNDLDDGGTWAFEVLIFNLDEDEIADYDIAVEDVSW